MAAQNGRKRTEMKGRIATYADVGKRVLVADDKDFTKHVCKDILTGIVQIEEEVWYNTEDNGQVPHCIVLGGNSPKART